ncbi:S1C family serine protease [uncultured Pseudoflavonifractor sp.]|uniref:S1C family serine protease n=1 Tax=uncultured Pseudoflavonifractor sp. TaxID=1221379 RepID=UPI0025E429CA|nr:trypsin-like peptidase domain-containing protein [uncultured Pseudoflavonifractor sp.]
MRTDYYTTAPAGGGPGWTGTPRYTVIPFEAPPPEEKKRRGSRKAPWIFAVFLVLIVALTGLTLALSWMLAQSGESGETTVESGGGNYTLIPIPTASDSAGTTDLERAPTGTGVTLTVAGLPDQVLTYQEIYDRNIAAIVSIRAYQTGGGATGTGVVMTADGYIITNYHVIQGSYQVEVVLLDDSVHQALLVGGDQTNDLAVLKIDAQDLTPAEFGDSDQLQVGDPALAIGNPLGEELRGTMTDGIISAISRDVNVDGNTMTLIQTTAALNSGNSGGALLNDRGQVVGITNMKMTSYSGSVEGLGFAIPTSTVKAIVDELIAYGHVRGYPTLGILGSTMDAQRAAANGLVEGVYVQSVTAGSDAEKQGMRSGDVITECNGQTVTSVDDINAIKEGFQAGDVLTFRVYRNGEYLDLEVRLMERYELDQ